MDVYVASKDGLFLYNAFENSLSQILKEDVREATGVQPFVKDAAINLVYVINNSKIPGKSEEAKSIFPAISAGAIIQNVYLFCASEGLVTVARGLIQKDKFAGLIGIRDTSIILMAQSVGYPEE
jgi:nitroreductase